jgi:hypothetical protein
VHRLFQDDLASVSISRLHDSSAVTRDTKSVDIVFGDGKDGLRREVKVVHQRFSERRRMVVFPMPCLRAPRTHSQAARQADVSALLPSRWDWISRIERHTRRARRRAGGAAREVARGARRQAGEIAPRPGRRLDRPWSLTVSLRRRRIQGLAHSADELARLHPRPVRTFDRVGARNITSAAHIRRRGRPRIARFNGVRFCDPRRFLQNHVTPPLSGAQTPEIDGAQRAPSRDSLSLTLNPVSLFPTRSAR